ncbi:MAG: hypothetical protein QE271_04380 [Bacteriovoracaceae bacterium]|nr:hypothetical protein [Bacteriovoracaceae bacterium]
MNILKDALLKAGLKPTQQAKAPKDENHREHIPKKKLTETVVHQEQRNFCEECSQVRPDVEFYAHKNPTSEAEWICLRCADQLQILDVCRRTAQSDVSIKRMFRRGYGATVRDIPITPRSKNAGPVDGNR